MTVSKSTNLLDATASREAMKKRHWGWFQLPAAMVGIGIVLITGGLGRFEVNTAGYVVGTLLIGFGLVWGFFR